MDPRDDALLQDLLDERLAPAEADALRARRDTEPDLQEAWDELRRIREVVRGPVDRAPPDFLRRVRERLAAEADGASRPVGADGSARPTGRLLHLPRGLAAAASAVAALLLVALGVRWMGMGDAMPPAVESAKAPVHDRWAADDEVSELGEVARYEAPPPGTRTPAAPREPAGDLVAPAAPPAPAADHASPATPAPVPAPARRPGHFAPADQVPPNLRQPSDERTADAVPPRSRRGAPTGTTSRLARKAPRPPAAATWALEAEDVETGRARLALLLGAATRTEGSAPRLRTLRAGREGDEVLGSVLLCLTPEQAAALAPRPGLAGGAGGRLDDAPAGADKGRTAAPSTPDAPDADGEEAEALRRAKETEPAKKTEAAQELADAAACVRVRVLVVRGAAGR